MPLAEDEKRLEISGISWFPLEMRSNLQTSTFRLKVRTRGPQPSICVRTFSLFTTILVNDLKVRPNQPQGSNFGLKVRTRQNVWSSYPSGSRRRQATDRNSSCIFLMKKRLFFLVNGPKVRKNEGRRFENGAQGSKNEPVLPGESAFHLVYSLWEFVNSYPVLPSDRR